MKNIIDNCGPTEARNMGNLVKSNWANWDIYRDDEDDLLTHIYSVEELRSVLREAGVIGKKQQEGPGTGAGPDSPYAAGNGVVLSLTNNPDKSTNSIVYVSQGHWTGDHSDGGRDECYTQSFQRRQKTESLYAKFLRFPTGRHNYVLGLGYYIQFGELEFNIFEYGSRMAQSGLYCPVKKPISHGLLSHEDGPIIAFFDHDPTDWLRVTVNVRVPNWDMERTWAWFHHIQLVQVD